MFDDFIKHYDNIRYILRDIFLYGCFSREELEIKNSHSSRKISYEMRRIQQYIEKEFIGFHMAGRNKLLRLSYDSITSTKNFLIDTYYSKSFTKRDITLHFQLLLALNSLNKPSTLIEIESLLIEKGILSYDNISRKTIERKLKELSNNLGLVKCEKMGKSNYYDISKDVLNDFTSEELERLYMVVSLYKNILFPYTLGHYCEDILESYMKYERNIPPLPKDCFQYKNLHFHPTIDEELLWDTMKAINNSNFISIKNDTRKNRHKSREKQYLKPYKIRYDVNCGRFYIIAFNTNNSCISIRIDRIEKLTIHNEWYDKEELKELYDSNMINSWSSVPCKHSNPKEMLKFMATIENSDEEYVINKIQNELGTFTLEQLNEKQWSVEKEVNDAWEIIPWIRSYYGYVEVLSPTWLRKKLESDREEMIKSYGVV